MNCPDCHGELEMTPLHTRRGALIRAKRCSQCQGFWFDNNSFTHVDPVDAARFDPAALSFSLQEKDLICPNDDTLMSEEEVTAGGEIARYWHCSDCQGNFLPRGQLATITGKLEQERNRLAAASRISRPRIAQATALTAVGAGLFVAAWQVSNNSNVLSAAGSSPLPTDSPNIIALVLFGITYLAGTVLTVLGRRAALVFLGWGVIIISLVGFAVVIFGP